MNNLINKSKYKNNRTKNHLIKAILNLAHNKKAHHSKSNKKINKILKITYQNCRNKLKGMIDIFIVCNHFLFTIFLLIFHLWSNLLIFIIVKIKLNNTVLHKWEQNLHRFRQILTIRIKYCIKQGLKFVVQMKLCNNLYLNKENILKVNWLKLDHHNQWDTWSHFHVMNLITVNWIKAWI